jgi:hypothetical protein
VGSPDGAALTAGNERVIDSLVGLGLLCRCNGEGMDLGGLHGGTSFLLTFPYQLFWPKLFSIFYFLFFSNKKTRWFLAFYFFIFIHFSCLVGFYFLLFIQSK